MSEPVVPQVQVVSKIPRQALTEQSITENREDIELLKEELIQIKNKFIMLQKSMNELIDQNKEILTQVNKTNKKK